MIDDTFVTEDGQIAEQARVEKLLATRNNAGCSIKAEYGIYKR